MIWLILIFIVPLVILLGIALYIDKKNNNQSNKRNNVHDIPNTDMITHQSHIYDSGNGDSSG